MTQGRPDEAIELLRKSLAGQDSPTRRHDLGLALGQRGETEIALAEMRRAADEGKVDLAHDFALRLQSMGRIEESIAAYERLIRRFPDHAEAHCNLGGLYFERGQFEKAIAERRIGHQLGSKRPDWRHPSREWLAEALVKRADEILADDPSSALALAREALELTPKNAPVHALLGRALDAEKLAPTARDPALALFHLQRAVAFSERKDVGTREDLVRALARNGLVAAAVDEAEDLLRDLATAPDGNRERNELRELIASLKRRLTPPADD